MRHAALGVGTGLGLTVAFLACAHTPAQQPAPDLQRAAKLQEILERWSNIQNWRHQAKLKVDPLPASIIATRGQTVKEARRVCADGHEVPKTCADVCAIGDDICDNAERICVLAGELGKDDVLAQEKCASAKASCREAQQECCRCSTASVTSPDGGQLLP
ncbi:MAG: hypothetical protein KF773_37370 [Deltaproteobacteria bacterium]|nr:hypothetical protein [Deltaproteobacteria bacterium]MCW5802880.1 hypothetical protein [Deltaproteobacteria bacterium]